jgi:hypothetical protein
MSVSVCSNVPGFESPKCFVRDERGVNQCVGDFVDYAHKIADKASELMKKKFEKILNQLSEVIRHREELELQYAKASFSNEWIYQRRANLCGIKEELTKYLNEVPIVGFNSQRYDLNVIKGPLVKKLCSARDKLGFVVKKLEAMTCLKTEKLKFLDVSNFIAPGFSYAKYLSAYGVDQQKGYFPYEWIDDLDKLNCETLPTKADFYDNLKEKGITDEEYDIVEKAWRDEKMQIVRDLLIWYNNLDVEPFLKALDKQSGIYSQ